jgi:hypothetical protein
MGCAARRSRPGSTTITHRSKRARFTLEKVLGADYVVCVQKSGFREVRRLLHVTAGETVQLQFQLNVASIFETVTVTPARGQPQELFNVQQSPNVFTENEIARRSAICRKRDVPGVHIQQTTSGQGSPFVRGLTGQQVLHLISRASLVGPRRSWVSGSRKLPRPLSHLPQTCRGGRGKCGGQCRRAGTRETDLVAPADNRMPFTFHSSSLDRLLAE